MHKAYAVFFVAVMLGCSGEGSGGIVDPPPPPPPPPPPAPPVTPTKTVLPGNPAKWVLDAIDTLHYQVAPASSNCSGTITNEVPNQFPLQKSTTIRTVSLESAIIALGNYGSPDKPMTFTLSCVNGTSDAVKQDFTLPVVSPPLVMKSISVNHYQAANGSQVYDILIVGSGMILSTACGTDNAPPVNETGWISADSLMFGISGAPNFNWAGKRTVVCANPNPEGSTASLTITVP